MLLNGGEKRMNEQGKAKKGNKKVKSLQSFVLGGTMQLK